MNICPLSDLLTFCMCKVWLFKCSCLYLLGAGSGQAVPVRVLWKGGFPPAGHGQGVLVFREVLHPEVSHHLEP